MAMAMRVSSRIAQGPSSAAMPQCPLGVHSSAPEERRPHGTTIDLYPLSYRATSRTAEISTASGVVSSGCPWPLSTHGHRQPDKSGMAGNHPSRSLSFAFGISKGRSAPRSIHSAGSTCCTTTPAARPRKTIPQLVTYASAPERAKTMSSCQTSFRRYGPCSTPTCHPAMRSGRT